MNLYSVSVTVWKEKVTLLACAVVAAAIAIVSTFHISFSPVSVQPRRFQMGVASYTLLVNSRRSALADAHASTSRLAGLTSQYTELINSPVVIDRVARAIGTEPSRIGVQLQISQRISPSQSEPLEPQVGEEILATRRHYYLLAHDISGNQTIELFAQAPTGRIATAMVTGAARGLSDLVDHFARQGHVPRGQRIIIQPLGQPSGRVLDTGVSKDAAILIGIASWMACFVAALTFKASRRRTRAGTVTSEPKPA
jgi:hypothetical protein